MAEHPLGADVAQCRSHPAEKMSNNIEGIVQAVGTEKNPCKTNHVKRDKDLPALPESVLFQADFPVNIFLQRSVKDRARHVNSLQCSPGNKIPAGPMPDSTDDKGNKKGNGRPRISLISEMHLHRLEQIIQKPTGERYMPPAPEFRNRRRKIGAVEISGQFYIENTCCPQGHVCITGKIAIKLDGVIVRCHYQRDPCEGMNIIIHR